jgi:hypothetical protein
MSTGGGQTLGERNLVESPFLPKPDYGRIHSNKPVFWYVEWTLVELTLVEPDFGRTGLW